MRKTSSAGAILLLAAGVIALYGALVANRSRLPPEAQTPVSQESVAVEDQAQSDPGSLASGPDSSSPDTTPVTCAHHVQILARLEQLARSQSNLQATVVRLAERLGEKVPGDPISAKAHQQALQALEQSALDHQQQAQTARLKMTELLTQLNPPDEVAVLEAKTALAMPSLRNYWPYFEAKREHEKWDLIAERLQLRIIQERIDAAIPSH